MTKQRMLELCHGEIDAVTREIQECVKSEDIHGAQEYVQRRRGMAELCQTLAAMWEEETV
mgnify:CR=1 FL=1